MTTRQPLVALGLVCCNALQAEVIATGFASTAVHARLQAKVWPAAGAEPVLWHVDTTTVSPELQGIEGGIALDS